MGKKRTKADFKREIKRGMTLKVVAHGIKPETIGTERVITEVRSSSIITDGSFYTEIPRANLLEYTGESFTIYQPGMRELTVDERKVERLLESGKVSKQEVKGRGYGYLLGERERGQRIVNKHVQGGIERYIEDERIRGPILVKYDIISKEIKRRRFKEYYRPSEREMYGSKGYRVGGIIGEMVAQGDIEGILIEGGYIPVGMIEVKRVERGQRVLRVGQGKEIKIPEDGSIIVKDGVVGGSERIYLLYDGEIGSFKRQMIEIQFVYR